MSKLNPGRAILAGVIGTAVMTMTGLYAAPMMGIPRMNPADMLAAAMGGNLVLGWGAHFTIGVVLAVGYAFMASVLPGPAPVSGALFGLAPYLMAQLLVMPMMGMPVFSGSMPMSMGSLIGHVVYGAVVGGVYGGAYEGRRAAAGARTSHSPLSWNERRGAGREPAISRVHWRRFRTRRPSIALPCGSPVRTSAPSCRMSRASVTRRSPRSWTFPWVR